MIDVLDQNLVFFSLILHKIDFYRQLLVFFCNKDTKESESESLILKSISIFSKETTDI